MKDANRLCVAALVVQLVMSGCSGGKTTPGPQDGGPQDGGMLPDSDAEISTDQLLSVNDGGIDPATIAVPRPLSPMSGTQVTSQQPVLKWRLPTTLTELQIELCQAPTFATKVTTQFGQGSSALLDKALTPGVWYWRLRGRRGAIVGTQTSAIWHFRVGHRSAAVSVSSGISMDVNRDTYIDLAIGIPGSDPVRGRAQLYMGKTGGYDPTQGIELNDPQTTDASAAFGRTLSSSGDVNGDGYIDMVICAPLADKQAGRCYVYWGSVDGLSATTPSQTIEAPVGTTVDPGQFGSAVAAAGDVDGDGYADLVIGAYAMSQNQGRAYVYRGSTAGLEKKPSHIWVSPQGGSFGFSVSGACDFNGDGYHDVVVGAPGAGSSVWGEVYIFMGAADKGPPLIPTTTLKGLSNTDFGYSLTCAQDVNGDGYSDLVVGARKADNLTGKIFVYHGSAQGLGEKAASDPVGPDGPNGYFGQAVQSAGDMDGDGYDDIVVGAPGVAIGTGRVVIYRGAPSGIAKKETLVLTGPDGVGGNFGVVLRGVGDTNQDGFADIVVGAPMLNSNSGKAYLFTGSKSVLNLTPHKIFQLSQGVENSFFGLGL